MTVSGRFWLPGPVEVDPVVAEAMLRPMIGHRSAAGVALAERLQRGLRTLFGTDRPVIVATASATALMEAAVRSGVRERLLAVVSGSFGERFADIAERAGKEVVRLRVPRGDVLRPELLQQLLDGQPIDAVSMVHAETSTGALAPIADLIPLFRTMGDVVTIVDAVGSFGGMTVDPAAWNADFVLAASQKALAVPPGMAFAVASDRFLERARDLDDRGLYLDVVHLHQCAADARFPQTPALPVAQALDAQLGRLLPSGLAARFTAHRRMRERVEEWVSAQGAWSLLAPTGHRADTVSVLRRADATSARDVVAHLGRAGYQVSLGHGDPDDREIRIGHLGEVTVDQLDLLLAALDARS